MKIATWCPWTSKNPQLSFQSLSWDHVLWISSYEKDQNISKTFVFFFHHIIQHDEVSVILFLLKLIAQINMFKQTPVLSAEKPYCSVLKKLKGFRFPESLSQSENIENIQTFQWLSCKNISKEQLFRKSPSLEKSMLFLLALKWNL